MGMTASDQYEVLAIQFRDIPDAVNRRKRYRVFETRAYKLGDKADLQSAVKELCGRARKHGLTEKEIIKMCRVKLPAQKT